MEKDGLLAWAAAIIGSYAAYYGYKFTNDNIKNRLDHFNEICGVNFSESSMKRFIESFEYRKIEVPWTNIFSNFVNSGLNQLLVLAGLSIAIPGATKIVFDEASKKK